jgi:hypothetical protein
MNKTTLYFLTLLIILFGCSNRKNEKSMIKPGEIWNDTDGNPINAHGGSILYDHGTYYWYGEVKKGKTWRVSYIDSWECYRTDAGGVSCYSSKDLLNWKNEGLVLPSEKTDSTHDLHFSKVIERPKVIYNEKTKKYVLWMHVDSEDYLFARAGVATSDSPTGPFKYIESVSPYNQMSRDMTLFKDDDGRAYHVFSSEGNATMYISLLDDDYLKHSSTYKRVFINLSREAPAIIKHENKYYMVSSACSGWSPNKAMYAVADSMLGEWKMVDNPCIGDGSDTTYGSQSTFLLPISGADDKFIFMADKWNKTNLEDSRYVWLPGKFENKKMIIQWNDQWDPNLNKNE